MKKLLLPLSLKLSVFAVLMTASLVISCSSKTRIRETESPLGQYRPGGIGGGLAPKEDPTEDCQKFIETIPADYEQGYVEVPQNWSKPEDKKIQVFYYGKIEKNKPPVVFFNGGPGGSSHSSFKVLSKLAESQDHSLIYIDQRGTGCSSQYPNVQTQEDAKLLAQYSSRAIVMDAEVVREKLLGPGTKWKVFGQSFGALIAYRYLILAPQSLISVHAHGFSIMKNQSAWVALRLLEQRRTLEKYFETYKFDKMYLQNLRSQIPEDHCVSSLTHELCGVTMLDPIFLLLGFKTSWASLNTWFAKMQSADMVVDYSVIDKFAKTFALDWFFSNTTPNTVISRVDVGNGLNDVELCRNAMQLLEEQGETPNTWLLNECRLYLNVSEKFENFGNSVSLKPDVMTNGELLLALLKNPTVRLYVYSGNLDVFVPTSTFDEMKSTLQSMMSYTSFPNTGHDGFYTEPLVWKNLKK